MFQTKKNSNPINNPTASTTAFKQAMAQLASGVSVITTLSGDQPVGITASSFTSLSLEPPLVMVAINKKLFTHRAIRKSGKFATSILSAEQVELGKRFAGLIPEISNRFAGLETFTAGSGSPILTGCLAWVDCRLWAAYDGGDHSIFVGEVLEAEVGNPGQALVYYNRQWRSSKNL